MEKKQLIQALQQIVTTLSNQKEMHMMQARIFEDQEFIKLSEKYDTHAGEERDFQNRFMQRILDLDEEIKLQPREEMNLYKDPVEFIKNDLEISKKGVGELKGLVKASIEDPTSYDLLKDYYEDEEEDMFWSETQLELIEKIGKENWLLKQL